MRSNRFKNSKRKEALELALDRFRDIPRAAAFAEPEALRAVELGPGVRGCDQDERAALNHLALAVDEPSFVHELQ